MEAKAPTFLAIGPHCWGRGKTVQQAKKNAGKNLYNPGGKPFRYTILKTEDETVYVDGMGRVVAEKPVVTIEEGGHR